jgi:hypothetical protein
VETYHKNCETYPPEVETYHKNCETYPPEVETYHKNCETYPLEVETYHKNCETYPPEVVILHKNVVIYHKNGENYTKIERNLDENRGKCKGKACLAPTEVEKYNGNIPPLPLQEGNLDRSEEKM